MLNIAIITLIKKEDTNICITETKIENIINSNNRNNIVF